MDETRIDAFRPAEKRRNVRVFRTNCGTCQRGRVSRCYGGRFGGRRSSTLRKRARS